MQNKVILISVDGMRPDGMRECGNPYVSKLEKLCAYTYNGSSVKPSVTLPCHYSMAHSVAPDRHGILTNTYTPPVHPVKGIFEKVKEAGGKTAMFYGWELIRDIASPGALKFVTHINSYIVESSDTYLTDECIRTVDRFKPDFVFLYLIETDEKGGHDNGWMTEEYKRRVSVAIDNVKRIIEKYGDEYRVIIMADHGGHDRVHGTELPEDMIIPFFFYGPEFDAGEIKEPVTLLDIAPTVAKLFGIDPEKEWEGHSLI